MYSAVPLSVTLATRADGQSVDIPDAELHTMDMETYAVVRRHTAPGRTPTVKESRNLYNPQ